MAPKVVDAAMGSALVAASSQLGSLADAAEQMIQYDRIVEPDADLAVRYDEIYGRFLEDLARNSAARRA